MLKSRRLSRKKSMGKGRMTQPSAFSDLWVCRAAPLPDLRPISTKIEIDGGCVGLSCTPVVCVRSNYILILVEIGRGGNLPMRER